MSRTAADIVSALQAEFGPAILATREFRGEHSVDVSRDSARALLAHCRDSLGFDYLIDISSLDHYGSEPRFEMVYELYSLANGEHIHLRVKYTLTEDEAAPTASDLWPTANWHEREVYDMMGIRFDGHPDLRRILMWEGYPYYPLRKDFPLAGRVSDLPEVAFTNPAPLAGGPFVTSPTSASTVHREPRSREMP
ncbi:MAG: NADH-quinone oxidoreductase subunit C [Verrucomicrobiales bacterium]|nr:NADH-quinone oxidoreductase subunit C [Verrucomicrobiales bacterium]